MEKPIPVSKAYKFKPSKIFKGNMMKSDMNEAVDFVFQANGTEYRISVLRLEDKDISDIQKVVEVACSESGTCTEKFIGITINNMVKEGVLSFENAADLYAVLTDIRVELGLSDIGDTKEEIKSAGASSKEKVTAFTMAWPTEIGEAGKKMVMGLIGLHKVVGYKGKMPEFA